MSGMAGRPIILDETEAYSESDLVVIATISAAEDVPPAKDDPFGGWGSEWHKLGFTKVAKVKVERTLFGTAPDGLAIYGGKLGAGTDFRIEEGRYLVLLTRVKEDAYRALDYHYSFSPIRDGKVGWLIERHPVEREWISPEEALQRIEAYKEKAKATKTQMATPRKLSD